MNVYHVLRGRLTRIKQKHAERTENGCLDSVVSVTSCKSRANSDFSTSPHLRTLAAFGKIKRPDNFLQNTIRVASAAVLHETGKFRLQRRRWKTRPTRACPKAFFEGHARACGGA